MQGLQLLPAAILAETTLSFAGLGFAPDAPSWGTLLHDASDLAVLNDAPWLLAAAGAVDHGRVRDQPRQPVHRSAARSALIARPGRFANRYNVRVPLDLAGILPPVATPFVDDEVDLAAMRANCERWMRTGLRGVLLLGTNGEAPLIRDEEAVRLVAAAREAVPRRSRAAGRHRTPGHPRRHRAVESRRRARAPTRCWC